MRPFALASRVSKIRRLAVASPALVCFALLASCETTEVANAPPSVVEECRREVALITEREPELSRADRLPAGEAGPSDEVLDDARVAREEAGQEGLAAWPEEALLYRCLASRGVQLTDEQARTLAEWEARPEPE
jgi:hypothetical protein